MFNATSSINPRVFISVPMVSASLHAISVARAASAEPPSLPSEQHHDCDCCRESDEGAHVRRRPQRVNEGLARRANQRRAEMDGQMPCDGHGPAEGVMRRLTLRERKA